MPFRWLTYLLPLALLLFLMASCTIPIKSEIMPRQPIELVTDVRSPRIPYQLDILDVDANETKQYRDHKPGVHDITYIFHTGKYLKSAAESYLPAHFAPYADKSIGLRIWTNYIRGERTAGEGTFSADVCKVEVTLGTRIFYDGLTLYNILTQGSAFVKVQFGNEPMEEATRMAIIEAIKKIPVEVAGVLADLNSARLRLKEDIERRIKTIPIDLLTTPRFVNDYISLANLSRVTKNYEEGIAAARRAIDLHPKTDAAHAILGLIYKEQKKYSDADIYLKKEQELNPNWLLAYWKLAELYWETENYESAIMTLEKAIEKNPNNKQTQILLSQTLLFAGKFEKAIAAANKAIVISTITGIGAAINTVGEYTLVKEIWENGPAKKAGLEVGDRIIKIDGQSIIGWNNDQILQKIKGEENTKVTLTIERKETDKPFDKIISREKIIFKDAAPALAIRALSYRYLGQKIEFHKDAAKAYELNPNNDWTKWAISISLMERNKFKESLDILSYVKDKPFERLLAAIVYARSRDPIKAVDIYSLIPDDYLASKNSLKESYKNEFNTLIKPFIEAKKASAKSFEREGKYREAIKEYASLIKIIDEREAKEIRGHIAELIAKFPHLFQLTEEARKIVIKAESYTEEGKFPEAIEEYKKALNLSPFFPALYKALALNYAQLKDYSQAMKNMNIYLELYPDAPDFRAAKDAIYKWEFMMEKEKR